MSVAVASDVVEMVGAAFTVIVSDWVSLTPLASVIETVKVWVDAEELTVPLITPVVPFSVRPVGSEPCETLQLLRGAVPPVSVKVCE